MKKHRESIAGLIGDLDIRLLRIFKAVVDCGGLSAAEVELNIGRSAISRHMSDLEARLDMRLCQRGRSGFCVTDQGHLVYESTQQLLADMETFRNKINTAHSRLVGTFYLAMTDDTVTDVESRIPEVLALFRELAPDVQIIMQVLSPNEIERAVIEGRAHLGVIPCHHHLPALKYYSLYEETQLLYCGADHKLFSVPESLLSAKRIGACDFVTPGYIHSVKLKKLFPQREPVAQTNQMEGVATLILSNSYLGFLPDHYAAFWVAQGKMRVLLPERLRYQSPFKAIIRKDSQPNLLRDTFLSELRKLYRGTDT